MPKCIHCNEFLIQLGGCWWCPVCGTVVDEKGEWKSPKNRKLSWIEEHDLRVEKERLAQEQAKQAVLMVEDVLIKEMSLPEEPVIEEKPTEKGIPLKSVVKSITDRFKGR